MVGIVLQYSHTPIFKAWGSTSRTQHPLRKGIVRRQFPSFRGTMWRNNGRSPWNGSRFKHICAFYVEVTNIHKVKLKMSCYNCDLDRSVRVCSQYTQVCANSMSTPRANALGIWLPVSHTPSFIGTTNPFRTGLIPWLTHWGFNCLASTQPYSNYYGSISFKLCSLTL